MKPTGCIVEKCKPDCPECQGTGYIGGDTKSMWACVTYSARYMRANKLGPYAEKKCET